MRTSMIVLDIIVLIVISCAFSFAVQCIWKPNRKRRKKNRVLARTIEEQEAEKQEG